MAGTSFLSPGDVATIHQVEADAFATLVALEPFDLILLRFDHNTGDYVPRSMQTVVVAYNARRDSREQTSSTSETQYAEGTFEKDLPFDVIIGDRFTFATGQTGFITATPPAVGATQVVSWRTSEGRA